MNVVNRLLGLLFLLLVLAAALATIGLVTDLLTVPDVRQVWAYGPVVTITHDVGQLGAGRWPWVLGGAIVAGLIALILLVRELTPPRRHARVLVLPGKGPGRTEVPYSALDELAERSAREGQRRQACARAGGTAAPGSGGALPGAGQPLRGPGDNRTGAAAHDCGASAARDRAARAGAHDRAGGAAAAAGAHDRAAGAAAGALGGRTR
jgi:hypothetical protein